MQILQIMEGPNARPFDNLSTFTASATLPSVPQPNALNMHSTVHSTRSDLFAPLVDKDDLESSDEEYGSIRLLTEHVDALSLATDGGRSTFHGKSSLTGVIVQIAQTVASSSSRVADNSNLSHSNTIPQHHSVPWVTARVYVSTAIPFTVTYILTCPEYRRNSAFDPPAVTWSSSSPNHPCYTNWLRSTSLVQTHGLGSCIILRSSAL